VSAQDALGALGTSCASCVPGSFKPDDDRPMARRVGRLIFYPLAIGLFLLVDTALRATGH
jgi:hypothetical protein